MKTKRKAIFPEGMLVPRGYRVRPDGVWRKRGKGRRERLASTPAWVDALTCDANGGDWSLLIAFLTLDGDLRKHFVPYASLLGGGLDLSADLVAKGLLVMPLGAAHFATYLAIGAAHVGIRHYREVPKGPPATR